MGNKKAESSIFSACISPIDSFCKTTQETTKHLILLASLNAVVQCICIEMHGHPRSSINATSSSSLCSITFVRLSHHMVKNMVLKLSDI
jgi:hypothetical protein